MRQVHIPGGWGLGWPPERHLAGLEKDLSFGVDNLYVLLGMLHTR